MSLLAAAGAFTSLPATVILLEAGRPATEAARVPRWQVEEGDRRLVARAAVEFGPYPADATFDAAVLRAGPYTETFPLSPPEVLPAGVILDYALELRWVRDG